MGSSTQTETQKQYTEIPDWLKGQNQNLINTIMNQSNQWNNHAQGTLAGNLYNTAMGNNLNQVNPKEQELFNQQLDAANNATMRQFAAAGRGGSFTNMEAVNDQTSGLTNQFLSDNYNRNRQAQVNAQQQYMQGLANSNAQALGAVQQNSTQVSEQTKPGNNWLQNTLNIAGTLIPLVTAPMTGGASLAGLAGGALFKNLIGDGK